MKQILLSLIAFMAVSSTTYAQTCTPQGDQTTYGLNDVWIGYVYNNPDFTDYAGYVTQGAPNNPFFDQNFGGDDVSYPTNGCPVQTESFSVRYKMSRVVPNGTYQITVAGDDGYRFSVDGGATWIINKWNIQTYMSTTVNMTLSGTVNVVLEYFENSGPNRITLAFGAVCIPMENQATYGSNNIWKGYVYEGTGFNIYKGMVNEGTSSSFVFDENFGTDLGTYNTSACPVTTENFSVRYRLNKSLVAGTYTFILGADDGYRMSLDGGATWVINNWTAHTYTVSSYNVSLSGSYNMVVEYYEASGINRINFNMIQNSVLPISLLNFAGSQHGSVLDLSWKVAEESDPASFGIEKSTDGVGFKQIGLVAATSATSYTFTDKSLTAGTAFYRMKMADRSGTVVYSNVISVRTGASAAQGVNVFPNIITGNSLYIETAAPMTKAMIVISDAGGRQVNRKVLGKIAKGQVTTLEVSPSKLPAGMYFLQVLEGNESVSVKRFIVK